MNEVPDLQRFQELVEASAHRELTEAETAFIGRMGFQSQECRQWLETDAQTVTAALTEDPLRNVPAPSSLDWARLETGLRRAGALPDTKSRVQKPWPILSAAAAIVLCIGVVYAILRDGLSDAPAHSSEMVVEILDLPENDGSLIFDGGEDDDGVLMIVISNG
ncbi:MAG TPA: hypothetical protein EYO84_03455 [Planctomycetes bacterium]|nr:hypothetical protein [Planctomycetota bacterium]